MKPSRISQNVAPIQSKRNEAESNTRTTISFGEKKISWLFLNQTRNVWKMSLPASVKNFSRWRISAKKKFSPNFFFFAFMKTKKIVISGFHSVMISRKFFKKFYLDQLLFCLFRNCWKESLELLDDNNSGSHSCRDRQGQEVLSSSSLGWKTSSPSFYLVPQKWGKPESQERVFSN